MVTRPTFTSDGGHIAPRHTSFPATFTDQSGPSGRIAEIRRHRLLRFLRDPTSYDTGHPSPIGGSGVIGTVGVLSESGHAYRKAGDSTGIVAPPAPPRSVTKLVVVQRLEDGSQDTT